MTEARTIYREAREPLAASKPASIVAVVLLFALALLAASAAPGSGEKVQQWGEPVLFNKTYSTGTWSDVSLDEAGNGIIVSQGWDGCDYTLWATVAPAGEAWGAPDVLFEGGCSTSGSNNTGGLLSTATVNGRAAVLVDRSNGSDRLAVAFHNFEEGWGTLLPVGGSASRWISGTVVLDLNGTATVVWEERDLFQDADLYARKVSSNGSLGDLIVLEDTPAEAYGAGWGPTATDNGTVHLVWEIGKDADAEIHATTISPTGAVTETVYEENLTGVCCRALSYASNADGYQVILRSIQGGGNTESWVRTAGPDGVWSDGSYAEPTDSGAHQWAGLAIDGEGTVHLLFRDWPEYDTIHWSVLSKPLGGAWTTRVPLANQSGHPEWGRIVANHEGAIVATWGVRGDTSSNFTAVARDADGTWGTPLEWAPDTTTRIASGLDAAIDGSGNAVVVWIETNYTDMATRTWTLRFGAQVEPAEPPLILAQAAPPAPTNAASFEVRGSVEPGTLVSVQGVDVPVLANGSFAATVPLEVGNNTIVVVARSPTGGSVMRVINVQRLAVEPPEGPPPVNVQRLDPLTLLGFFALAFGWIGAFLWIRAQGRERPRP